VGNGVEVGVLAIAATATESSSAIVGVGVTTPEKLETVFVDWGIGVVSGLSAVKPQPDNNQNKPAARQVIFIDTDFMSKVG